MMAPADTVLVVGNGDRIAPDGAVARALRGLGLGLHATDEEHGVETLRAWLAADRPPPAVLLTPDLARPVAVARKVHAAAPLVQIVFLVDGGGHVRLRRELGPAPRIGHHWTMADADDASLPHVLEAAVRSTRQRSNLRTTLDRMNLRMSDPPPPEAEAYGRLVVSDRLLASILEYAEDAILSLDARDAVATWNGGAERLFGLAAAEAIGRRLDLLVDGERAGELATLVRTARAGRPTVRHAIVLRKADDSPFDAEITLAPVRDADDRVAAVSLIVRDVSDSRRYEERIHALNAELEARVRDMHDANAALKDALERLEAHRRRLLELNERLELQATTDPLTGLKNRIVFQNSLLEMIAVAARGRTPLSMLLVDLDHFKRINDTGGHLEGDRVLVAVADALAHHTREQDIVARFGGEEFVVLLPNTDPDAARAVAENLRVGCRNATDADPPLTVSIGVASHEPGDTDVSLTDRADRALYAAKERGRNRVVHAKELDASP